MRSNNKRDAILEAALRVVANQGASHLTIDAVASESGMSKGGVLYHFASKRDLLLGMLTRLIDANEARVSKSRESKNSLTAALHLDDRMTTTEQRASLALLAAAAESPELLDTARDYMKAGLQTALTDVEDENLALLLILANEGLRFLDILDLNPMDQAQNAALVSYMGKLAEEV